MGENLYANEATFLLRATKVLTGRTFLHGDHFTFVVEGSEGAPMPTQTRVEISPTAGQLARVDFGTIVFTAEHAERDFVYTVREIAEESSFFTYDTPERHVRVQVRSSGPAGSLQLSVQYGEGDDERAIIFSSQYAASGVAEINLVKDLHARDWTEHDSFAFVIAPLAHGTFQYGAYEVIEGGAGMPMPAKARVKVTKENTEVAHRQHLADPWRIAFDVCDLCVDPVDGIMKGDFFYEMKEEVPAGAVVNVDGTRTFDDVVYSDAVFPIHVHVEDNRRGALVASVYYGETERGNIATASRALPVFTNTSVSLRSADTDKGELAAYPFTLVDGVTGAVIKATTVKKGEAVDVPEPACHAGYTFSSWVGPTEGPGAPAVLVATYVPDLDRLFTLRSDQRD